MFGPEWLTTTELCASSRVVVQPVLPSPLLLCTSFLRSHVRGVPFRVWVPTRSPAEQSVLFVLTWVMEVRGWHSEESEQEHQDIEDGLLWPAL